MFAPEIIKEIVSYSTNDNLLIANRYFNGLYSSEMLNQNSRLLDKYKTLREVVLNDNIYEIRTALRNLPSWRPYTILTIADASIQKENVKMLRFCFDCINTSKTNIKSSYKCEILYHIFLSALTSKSFTFLKLMMDKVNYYKTAQFHWYIVCEGINRNDMDMVIYGNKEEFKHDQETFVSMAVDKERFAIADYIIETNDTNIQKIAKNIVKICDPKTLVQKLVYLQQKGHIDYQSLIDYCVENGYHSSGLVVYSNVFR